MRFARQARYSLCLALGMVVFIGQGMIAAAETPRMTFESDPRARFQFSGPVGDRVQANEQNWLLRAPQANPGMLEMFRVRDRQP
ncbi:MAG TPA: hypothetical protein VHH73_19735, partial [Verrucomicrobiae bacterium]|nr:hypothetical protein [Verrucomicrobiae bacterium]